MPDVARVLREKLQAAFDTIVPGADPTLRPSERADFQANGALALAKQVGDRPVTSPRTWPPRSRSTTSAPWWRSAAPVSST